MMSKADGQKNDFKKLLLELEQIVDWFEKTDIDLSEGTDKYKRALEITKELEANLQKTEKEIEVLEQDLEIGSIQ